MAVFLSVLCTLMQRRWWLKDKDQGAGITDELQEAFHTFIVMMMEKQWLEEPVGHLSQQPLRPSLLCLLEGSQW